MRVGSLFGIQITIDVSWVFVFALVAWSLASPDGPLHRADVGTAERVLLGVVGSLLFFGSVLVHELAHSLVAKRRGIRVRGIRLFIFGGISMFEDEARDAPGEAWIAGVGPLTSLLLGAVFAGCTVALGTSSPAGTLSAYLAFVNVALAVFNMLPAYPLDGGRVLHSVLWKLGGNRDRADDVTVRIGRSLAALIVGAGIFETLAYNTGAGLWTTFIGWYLFQVGGAQAQRITIARALQGHLAGELGLAPDLRIDADSTGASALQKMRGEHVRVLPVVLGDRILGVVTQDALTQAGAEELDRQYVTALMTRVDDLDAVASTSPADGLIDQMGKGRLGAVGLIDARGAMVGVATADSVLRWLAHSRTGR